MATTLAFKGLTLWPPRALLQKKLTRDILFLQASNFLQKGYGFIFSVVAARLLGTTGYGEFLLVMTLYQTVNLLGSLGFGQFLVVPLAQAAAAGDREEVAAAAGYNLKLSALVGSGVLVVVLALGPWLADLLVRRSDLPELGDLLRIVALTGPAAMLYNVATFSLQAVRRMFDLAVVENVDIILSRALPFAALVLGWGLPGLLWGMVAGGILSALHALYHYHRVAVRRHGFPSLGPLLGAAWRVPLRRYFRFSFLAVMDKNVSQLFGQTPTIFLGRFAPTAEIATANIAYFTVASKVYTVLAAFHGAASKAFSARLAQEMGSQGPQAARRLFWRTSLVWGGVSLLLAGGLTVLLPLFRLAYGAQYFPSLTLVILMGLLNAKQGFTVSFGSIFLICNRVATNVLVKLPLIAVAVPLGVLAVQRWGASGAAGYQLGAFLAGDLAYGALLLTPWFWRGARRAS